MKLLFVSNYLNHHQIPLSNALFDECGGDYAFVQIEKMAAERVNMGWQDNLEYPYLYRYYENPVKYQEMIDNAEVVIFGGVEDEKYIAKRLDEGRKVIRYSERLYREGRWKFISPRGLVRKYHDHTRHQKDPVILLCSGAYTAGDFKLIRAYEHNRFRFGYFPETKHYDFESLYNEKNAQMTKTPTILWAGRFIPVKHPEIMVKLANELNKEGCNFKVIMIGGGELFDCTRNEIERLGLGDKIELPGFVKPETVRSYMEKADVFVQTSDKGEGWGAVINEAMNSGCAVVANVMEGAALYLIENGQNGYYYRNGDFRALVRYVKTLITEAELRKELGQNAYKTIVEKWNAEEAAKRIMRLIEEMDKLCGGKATAKGSFGVMPKVYADGPCSKEK